MTSTNKQLRHRIERLEMALRQCIRVYELPNTIDTRDEYERTLDVTIFAARHVLEEKP